MQQTKPIYWARCLICAGSGRHPYFFGSCDACGGEGRIYMIDPFESKPTQDPTSEKQA